MKSKQEEIDGERQKDEILALSHIYSSKEFSYTNEFTQCYYNVFPIVKDGLLELRTLNTSDMNTYEYSSVSKYFIKYLPPIRMHIQLPIDYPTKSAPNYYITTSWLSSWKISMICQKLDEIWLNNRGQEILFLWFEFLKNDLLYFLQIKDTLDISFLYMAYYNISSYFNLNLSYQHDVRAIYDILFFEPLQFLISYDEQQEENVFSQSYYTCIICFDMFLGEKCVKLKNCNHIYCGKCIEEYIALKIKENNVCDIECPVLSCNIPIAIHEIKSLCPNLFAKYEDTLLHITLKTIKNLVQCPRKSCEFSFIKDTDEELTICYKCDYTFCSYCYKVSAKPCPNCQTMIEKIDGCNKMTCMYCKANFCWLCGTWITTLNAYDHFLSITNKCYKRLFDL
ncbi:E3 ubiquitin-protein ligase RNF14-like isoform X2 [Nomia melanderi]|uniref:E3 ubiquitin-protein ligase RNF14-like isoform X2 n=1 Tax=Nomia melanderi TaxID=2448451 RepID=UPI003FCEE33E